MARSLSFVLALVVAVAVVSASCLEIRVLLAKEEVVAGEPVYARVSVFNPHNSAVRLLTWYTPFEGLRSNVFRVEHTATGRGAIYSGMVSKRVSSPPESAYVMLGAGQSHHMMVDLSEAYYFIDNGAHRIAAHFVMNATLGENTVVQLVSSDEVSINVRHADIDGSRLLAGLNELRVETLSPDAITYNACSASQQSSISSALGIAQSDATQAMNYVNSNKCNTAYITWYGQVTSTRFSSVKTNWGKIVPQLKSNNYKFDCTCTTPGTFAYVYPLDRSFTVYLCPAFWSAPSGSHQFDSRPGTLTHETSHFKAVAGTDDIEYGATACKRLATNSPNDAIKNADNYEFFQESNPRC